MFIQPNVDMLEPEASTQDERNAAIAIARTSTRPIYMVYTDVLTSMMDDQAGREMFGDSDWELALERMNPDVMVRRINLTVH